MELTSITPTPQMLRALSHPTRLRMLGMLRIDGPATATSLAARLGINTGQTSYHLRQLAQHGFVVDDAERGNGRERWWKAAHQSTIAGDDAARPEDRRRWTPTCRPIAVDLHPAAAGRGRGGAAAAAGVAGGLDPERLPRPRHGGARRELTTKMHDLFMELREDEDDDPDAVDFVFQFQAFPRPGKLGGEQA